MTQPLDLGAFNSTTQPTYLDAVVQGNQALSIVNEQGTALVCQGVGSGQEPDLLAGVIGKGAGDSGQSYAAGVIGSGGDGFEGVIGLSSNAYGVHGDSDNAAGVYGESDNAAGVYGESDNAAGVYGESRADATYRRVQTAGVYGSSANQPNPRPEDREGTNAGVWGDSVIDWGVWGTSVEAAGVSGYSQANDGVVGTTDMTGSAVGVRGLAPNGPGCVGVMGNAGGAGIAGLSDSNGVDGISVGTVFPRNCGVFAYSNYGLGIYAGTGSPSPSTVAGYFFGGLIVAGGVKSAAVPHPDGSHRLLYSVESPESWFEDFGRASLENGAAEVRLDPDFAAVVETDDYHVFLSPEGENGGLYIGRRSHTGFEVRESQGGRSSITFSYRVVARRSDVPLSRLQKVELPKFDDVIGIPDVIKEPKLQYPSRAAKQFPKRRVGPQPSGNSLGSGSSRS